MNPEIAFSWMLVGMAIIILSVPTTLAQRMGIAWLLILGGFLFIILYAIEQRRATSSNSCLSSIPKRNSRGKSKISSPSPSGK